MDVYIYMFLGAGTDFMHTNRFFKGVKIFRRYSEQSHIITLRCNKLKLTLALKLTSLLQKILTLNKLMIKHLNMCMNVCLHFIFCSFFGGD